MPSPKTAHIGQYNLGTGIIPANKIKISPSSFERFFSKPHEWFRELIMKEKGFDGNTGSILGSLVHGIAEGHANGEPVEQTEIDDYLSQINPYTHPDPKMQYLNIEPYIVKESYEAMAELVTAFIDEIDIDSTEGYIYLPLTDTAFVSGSYDYLRHDPMTSGLVVGDYKTTSEKLPPKSISYAHKLQAMIYCFIMKEQGKNITGYELVYITRYQDGAPAKISEKTGKLGKPGRDYPATLTQITNTYTESDHEFIRSLLLLCGETLDLTVERPDLAYIIHKDYRLKHTDFTKYLEKFTSEPKGSAEDEF